ncbi:MAG: sigma-70 family RNA polymerase sigma factor [Oscillospiraceae bacterium]|nr:sigma-70 family RNA polymerase sigma factor [Oscillospiraceae bacterium]
MTAIGDDGGREQFEKLYYKYNRIMYKVAMDILHSHELAEDALSTAFLNISRNFSDISSFPSEKIKNYCVIVIRNAATDILRKEKRFITESEAEYTEIADVENIETISDYNLLKKAISSLSEKEQEILYLRCIMNMSFREIGNILNIKEGTARQRMSEARNSLMKKIKGEDYV